MQGRKNRAQRVVAHRGRGLGVGFPRPEAGGVELQGLPSPGTCPMRRAGMIVNENPALDHNPHAFDTAHGEWSHNRYRLSSDSCLAPALRPRRKAPCLNERLTNAETARSRRSPKKCACMPLRALRLQNSRRCLVARVSLTPSQSLARAPKCERPRNVSCERCQEVPASKR